MGLLDQFLVQHVDPYKRRLRGLLTDPAATLEQTAYNAVEQRLPGFADAVDAQSVMPQMSGPALQKFGELGLNTALAAPVVFHGTQATRKWYDFPDLEKIGETQDLPRNIATSTHPIDSLRGSRGGLKMMDGLGPHVGTAEAANERLAKYHGISPSKAWNKYDPRLDESYIMPFDLQPTKPFTKKDGSFYTESELQSRLSNIAESLGFSKYDTRRYSAHSSVGKLGDAQKAVKKWLLDNGYDAIPYINSHEARGSTSWVVLDKEKLKPYP